MKISSRLSVKDLITVCSTSDAVITEKSSPIGRGAILRWRKCWITLYCNLEVSERQSFSMVAGLRSYYISTLPLVSKSRVYNSRTNHISHGKHCGARVLFILCFFAERRYTDTLVQYFAY